MTFYLKVMSSIEIFLKSSRSDVDNIDRFIAFKKKSEVSQTH